MVLKPLRIALAALACAALAHAQSLTGKWVGSASQYDDGLEFVLAVNQAADGAITGYIQGRQNDTITGGKVEGDKVTLEAERPGRGGGSPQKIAYNGVLAGGKLKLTMPAFGGRGPGAGSPAGGPPPA